MRIKVVLVEPKYQVNVGYAARIAKNFGVNRLVLVNPRCKHLGQQAIKYSKHGVDMLKRAAVADSIKNATKGSFVIGTTGIWHKTNQAFYNVFPLDEFQRAFGSALNSGAVSLVIGRDDTGLKKEELRLCDATVFIKASHEYPVLNLSHALAILLYELTKSSIKYEVIDSMKSSSAQREGIVKLFSAGIRSNPNIRDKASVEMAFRHVINRAVPTRKELNAIAIALAKQKKEK
jgi:TrmH family RNA methyltransferase